MKQPEDLKPEHRAAQLWCLPQFSERAMDAPFAMAIANAIREAEVDVMYDAWVLVSAAGPEGCIGNWAKMDAGWREAAEKWRDRFHAKLDEARRSADKNCENNTAGLED